MSAFFYDVPGGASDADRAQALQQLLATNPGAAALAAAEMRAMTEPPTVKVIGELGDVEGDMMCVEVAEYTLRALRAKKDQPHTAVRFGVDGKLQVVQRKPSSIFGAQQEMANPHFPPKRTDVALFLHEEHNDDAKTAVNPFFQSGNLAHKTMRGDIYMGVLHGTFTWTVERRPDDAGGGAGGADAGGGASQGQKRKRK